MSTGTRTVTAVAGTLGSSAVLAVASVNPLGAAFLGLALVLVTFIASATWLRSLSMVLEHGRVSGRLPQIGKLVTWEASATEDNQLSFPFPTVVNDESAGGLAR